MSNNTVPKRAGDPDRQRTLSPPRYIRPRSTTPNLRLPNDAVPPAAKRQKSKHVNPAQPIAIVKNELFSDEDDSSESESGYSPSHTSRGSPPPPQPNILQQARKDFNSQSAIPSHSKGGPPFCYNCKNYGHLKITCRNKWYYWWPQEYLSRYTWLKRRVHKTNSLKKAGRMEEFRRARKQIDDDVEREDTQLKEKQKDHPERYYAYRNPVPKSRRDGQRILTALRRVTPSVSPPGSPPPSICQGNSYQFSFEKRVEELERQIEQLRLALHGTGQASSSNGTHNGNKNHFGPNGKRYGGKKGGFGGNGWF